MKLRTDKTYGGRHVRLGDTAIVCVEIRDWDPETLVYFSKPAARTAICVGFRGDEPEWYIVGEFSAVFPAPAPRIEVAQFCASESDLAPGRWTW